MPTGGGDKPYSRSLQQCLITDRLRRSSCREVHLNVPLTLHYGLVKMCLCHIRKTRSVIVPWAHYSRALDTYTAVS